MHFIYIINVFVKSLEYQMNRNDNFLNVFISMEIKLVNLIMSCKLSN